MYSTRATGRIRPVSVTMITGHTFEGGFPTPGTVQKAYDEADLNRAIQAYRFFYPTVSSSAGFEALERIGIRANSAGALLRAGPRHRVYTASPDTPYALVPLDLREGPIVVDMPPGALSGVVTDLNQRCVMEMGLHGPDQGEGGRHVVLPPGGGTEVLPGVQAGVASTHRVILALRALPFRGDVERALGIVKATRIRPLRAPTAPATRWVDISERDWDCTVVPTETNLAFWMLLHRTVDLEPRHEAYGSYYEELAALGIAQGKPFRPDARMKSLLERAAQVANAQMRVQAFADRRADRVVWSDRRWEWVSGRPDLAGGGALPMGLDAREKWFFQTVAEPPVTVRRDLRTSSVSWLGATDGAGAYLDGGKTYRLVVPQRVPAALFWSVTVYDAGTRSQIRTDQGHAALRSMFELIGEPEDAPMELWFGPTPPKGHERRWIKTNAGSGWFVYFRLYGPERAAFDGDWRPGDFELIK